MMRGFPCLSYLTRVLEVLHQRSTFLGRIRDGGADVFCNYWRFLLNCRCFLDDCGRESNLTDAGVLDAQPKRVTEVHRVAGGKPIDIEPAAQAQGIFLREMIPLRASV